MTFEDIVIRPLLDASEHQGAGSAEGDSKIERLDRGKQLLDALLIGMRLLHRLALLVQHACTQPVALRLRSLAQTLKAKEIAQRLPSSRAICKLDSCIVAAPCRSPCVRSTSPKSNCVPTMPRVRLSSRLSARLSSIKVWHWRTRRVGSQSRQGHAARKQYVPGRRFVGHEPDFRGRVRFCPVDIAATAHDITQVAERFGNALAIPSVAKEMDTRIMEVLCSFVVALRLRHATKCA